MSNGTRKRKFSPDRIVMLSFFLLEQVLTKNIKKQILISKVIPLNNKNILKMSN